MKLAWLIPLAALAGVSAHAATTTGPAAPAAFEQVLLHEHNAARTQIGVAPLAWSDELAEDARAWANELARRGEMVHADHDVRRGAGENLWMGASGYFGPRDMVGLFVAESRWYRHGRFPNISSTGNWHDVGHYTQIIWSGTREVGCALARGQREEFLVCRYYPAGNVFDQTPY